ncbi:hypothetical protein FBBAL38_00020 [Flavobacteria bacterium BAL38]|nr:hypothetical protein FBBAL38_00020 [Flavobacteria bacterium BAL38]
MEFVMKEKDYQEIIVESFITFERGKHGPVHIRPLPGQEPYLETMFVQCTKTLSNDFPVGTKFKIRAKIIQPVDGRAFASSHYTWPYEVLK